MKPYLSEERLKVYKDYASFLFNSLGDEKQPIPKRTLSEKFQRNNRNHYTGSEYNFNEHVVPNIICHASTWEKKAQIFYVTATPVLGEKLKEKFERAGTLELDGNFRIKKFESTNFDLQRHDMHTAYHKTITAKSKRDHTRVQEKAFEDLEQRNADLDFENERLNKWTCHLRQEAHKFMILLLTFLGQRFPAVKASIDQVAEKLIKLDDYLDVNLTLSAYYVYGSVTRFVDSLASDNSNSPNGPEIKNVLEMLMKLLNNETNLHLVNGLLGKSLQEKFENMNPDRKISAESLRRALEIMIVELTRDNTNGQVGVDNVDDGY